MTIDKAKKEFKRRFHTSEPPGLLGLVCLYIIAEKKQEDWRSLFIDYFQRINSLPYIYENNIRTPDYNWMDENIEWYKKIANKRFNFEK